MNEGHHFINPFLGRVVFNKSLKEQVIEIHQTEFSMEWKPILIVNVYQIEGISLHNVLYWYLTLLEKMLNFNHKHVVQIMDPRLAFYSSTEDPIDNSKIFARHILSMKIAKIKYRHIQTSRNAFARKIKISLLTSSLFIKKHFN